MKRLQQLLARLPAATEWRGPDDPEITDIAVDSRAVRPGALFVAMRGERSDGHDYVPQAIERGAAAVVAERDVDTRGVPLAVTGNARAALSALAATFYDDPSHALDVVGVTGTNGKTTVTRMIAAIMNAGGRRCGIIGTTGAYFENNRWPLENTTPLPHELHALLARMRELGADSVAMEVSSHALALARVDDVRFRTGVLTNVTRDHLDFHETVEAYAEAKHRLFALAHSAVLNLGDEYGRRWYDAVAARVPVCTYALAGNADLVPSELLLEPGGSRFRIGAMPFQIALPGRFNVENALAAVGAARLLGVDDAAASRGLASLDRVPGRMEHVHGGGIDAVVDYAHTPDALSQALSALRETSAGRLIVVFGCGGDRDRGKRPAMGRVAAQFADAIYVTSDNPRSEDPYAIAREIVAGIGDRPYVLELDRGRAIERALEDAREGDTVLVAGKGHEDYQIVGERVFPFDDAEHVRAALNARGARI